MGSFIAFGIVVLILKLMGGAISISWYIVVASFLFEPLFLIWILLFNKVVRRFVDWMDGIEPEEGEKIKHKETIKEEELDVNLQEVAA